MAYEGDSATWRRVTTSLRDALVDHAIRQCPYYARTIPRGGRFEDIPILTRALIREHFDDLVAKDAPEHRKLSLRTAGTSGDPLSFLRDSASTLIHAMSSDRFFRSLHSVPFTATIIAVNTVSRPAERFTRWTGPASARRAEANPIPGSSRSPARSSPTTSGCPARRRDVFERAGTHRIDG